jgi:hypothetical protein
MSNDKVDEGALPESEQIAYRSQHHMLDVCTFKHFFKRVRKVLENDDCSCPESPKLMLQLSRGVKWIDVDHRVACTQHLRYFGQRHSAPFARLSDCNHAPKACDSSSMSRNLSRLSMQAIASRAPCLRKDCSSNSANDA